MNYYVRFIRTLHNDMLYIKDDFQRPTLGVNPVGLEEIYPTVGSNQAVPLCPLAPLAEEQPDITAGKGHVHCDMPASQAAAILAPFLRMVEESDKLLGGVLLPFIFVLRLAHLNHSKIMASDVAGGDELDNIRTGKPTVCKDVVKVNLALDNTAYHLNHQGYLVLVVFLNAHGGMGALCMILCESSVKLLLLQAIVAFLAFLSYEGKVEEHLADAVCDADEQPLETEHHRMRHMRENLADKLCLDARLGIVGVINHQTYRLSILCSPLLLSLAPKLERDGRQDLAPVIRVVRQETVERVALTAELAP